MPTAEIEVILRMVKEVDISSMNRVGSDAILLKLQLMGK